MFGVAGSEAHGPQCLAGWPIAEYLVVDILGGADARPVVAACRKYIGLLEHSGARELNGHDDVEGAAAGEADALDAVRRLEMGEASQHGVFEALLQGRRNILLALRD